MGGVLGLRFPRPRDGAVEGQVRGAKTFRGCQRLCEAEFHDKDAFRDCSSLGKVVVPSLAELIGERAFYDYALLKEADLRYGLERILPQAF